jgi:hypothetical protein
MPTADTLLQAAMASLNTYLNINPFCCRSGQNRWAWTGATIDTGCCWTALRQLRILLRAACSSSLQPMARSGVLPYFY